MLVDIPSSPVSSSAKLKRNRSVWNFSNHSPSSFRVHKSSYPLSATPTKVFENSTAHLLTPFHNHLKRLRSSIGSPLSLNRYHSLATLHFVNGHSFGDLLSLPRHSTLSKASPEHPSNSLHSRSSTITTGLHPVPSSSSYQQQQHVVSALPTPSSDLKRKFKSPNSDRSSCFSDHSTVSTHNIHKRPKFDVAVRDIQTLDTLPAGRADRPGFFSLSELNSTDDVPAKPSRNTQSLAKSTPLVGKKLISRVPQPIAFIPTKPVSEDEDVLRRRAEFLKEKERKAQEERERQRKIKEEQERERVRQERERARQEQIRLEAEQKRKEEEAQRKAEEEKKRKEEEAIAKKKAEEEELKRKEEAKKKAEQEEAEKKKKEEETLKKAAASTGFETKPASPAPAPALSFGKPEETKAASSNATPTEPTKPFSFSFGSNTSKPSTSSTTTTAGPSSAPPADKPKFTFGATSNTSSAASTPKVDPATVFGFNKSASGSSTPNLPASNLNNASNTDAAASGSSKFSFSFSAPKAPTFSSGPNNTFSASVGSKPSTSNFSFTASTPNPAEVFKFGSATNSNIPSNRSSPAPTGGFSFSAAPTVNNNNNNQNSGFNFSAPAPAPSSNFNFSSPAPAPASNFNFGGSNSGSTPTFSNPTLGANGNASNGFSFGGAPANANNSMNNNGNNGGFGAPQTTSVPPPSGRRIAPMRRRQR